MRVIATVSSVLAAMMLLLPWQICTCSNDGAHLKVLWSDSECAHDDRSDDDSSDDAGEQHDGQSDHDECDQLFSFAGAEGAVDLDLPGAEEGRSLLVSADMLPVIAGELPRELDDDPPRDPGDLAPSAAPLQMRAPLLL